MKVSFVVAFCVVALVAVHARPAANPHGYEHNGDLIHVPGCHHEGCHHDGCHHDCCHDGHHELHHEHHHDCHHGVHELHGCCHHGHHDHHGHHGHHGCCPHLDHGVGHHGGYGGDHGGHGYGGHGYGGHGYGGHGGDHGFAKKDDAAKEHADKEPKKTSKKAAAAVTPKSDAAAPPADKAEPASVDAAPAPPALSATPAPAQEAQKPEAVAVAENNTEAGPKPEPAESTKNDDNDENTAGDTPTGDTPEGDDGQGAKVLGSGAGKEKEKTEDSQAKQYLSTANAAIDVAAEAVVDAEDLETSKKTTSKARAACCRRGQNKKESSGKRNKLDIPRKCSCKRDKSKKGTPYLKAAKHAVDEAHIALSKASVAAGFGELPAPNYNPIKGRKKNLDLGRQYEAAAGAAVNVAEKAMDNLAAIGYPDVLPSVQDIATASVMDSPESRSRIQHETVKGGEYIEAANRAIDSAHEALEEAKANR